LAAPFDAERLELAGEAEVVLDGIAFTQLRTPVFDVADDGSMVYQRSDGGPTNVTLVWKNRNGESASLPIHEEQLHEPRIAPDKRQVAVRRGRDDRLWVLNLQRHVFTLLSDERVFSVLWHPEGEKIAYTPMKDHANLYWRNADGTGTEERLTTSLRNQWASDWSHDGAALFYTECDGAYVQSCDIGRVLMADTPSAELILATSANEQHPSLSPDGRWLAYESDQSGQFEIYVRPYPNIDESRWQVSSRGGRQPIWSPSGDEIYYAAGPVYARQLMSVSVTTDEGFDLGDPDPMFSFAKEGYAELRDHDLHPDGDRFLIAQRSVTQLSSDHLVYVVNWLDEVEQLVPTRR
jgi:serine/threonine-protein kinase